MKKTGTATQPICPSERNSTEALADALFFIQQALAKLHHIRSLAEKANNFIDINRLRRENELLRKELSQLETIVEKKI